MLQVENIKGLTKNDVNILDDVRMNGKNSDILPDKLVTILDNIINNNNIDLLDILSDGLNMVISQDLAFKIFDNKARKDLQAGETINQNTVENLLTIDHSVMIGGGQAYPLYINGYGNVEPATVTEVYDEITDVIDYLNNNL